MTKRDGMLLDTSDQATAARLERLITANEYAANALTRVAQLLESRETKKSRQKAARVRPLRKVVDSDPRTKAIAEAAVARILRER